MESARSASAVVTTPSKPRSQEWLEAVAHPSQPERDRASTTAVVEPNTG